MSLIALILVLCFLGSLKAMSDFYRKEMLGCGILMLPIVLFFGFLVFSMIVLVGGMNG